MPGNRLGGSLIKRIALCASLLYIALAQSSVAFATPIYFEPFDQTVNFGDSVSVDILVAPDAGIQIGAYDFFVNFDAAILNPVSVIFGSALGGPADSLEDFLFGIGALNLFGFSFLATLPQDGSPFVLATVVFDTVGLGTSDLSFTGNLPDLFGGTNGFLGDEFGILTAAEPGTGSIMVVEPPVAVPEPSTLILMLIGLSGILFLRPRVSGALFTK